MEYTKIYYKFNEEKNEIYTDITITENLAELNKEETKEVLELAQKINYIITKSNKKRFKELK